MIHLLTGWGEIGGSSVAHINLCNALNEANIPTIVYYPPTHSYIKSRCKSSPLSNTLPVKPDDVVIAHFLNLQIRLPVRKMILSSHEQDIFEVKKLNYKIYDKIHYVSKHQKDYHKVNHPSFIIPNIVDDLVPSESKPKKIAAIIGSLDVNKQTHVSILRAIEDGMEKVLLFGLKTDKNYYVTEIAPLLEVFEGKVEYKGFVEDKQTMYDSISDVYQDSLRETWGYVKAECELTNTKYHGNSTTNEAIVVPKKEIIEMWKKELEV